MRAAGLDTDAPEELDELAKKLRADGVKALPSEKQLAEELDLGHFYTRIYRTGQ
jgi:hypothetical protein